MEANIQPLPDPDPLEPTLADLIRLRIGTRSYARLSRDAGGIPTANRLQQLVTRPLQNRFPDRETIVGLARALNVSITDVLSASARSIGLRIPPADPSEMRIAGAGRLPLESQEIIFSLARELMRAHGELPRGSHRGDPDEPPESGPLNPSQTSPAVIVSLPAPSPN